MGAVREAACGRRPPADGLHKIMSATERSPLAQAIYEEAMAGPLLGARRVPSWDDCPTQAAAERWLAAHPDDPGPTPEGESRAAFEDAVDRLYDEPGDRLLDDDGPYAGNPRWAGGL